MTVDELLAAYRGTRYLVLDDEGATLAEATVGEPSSRVDALLAAHDATSGTFITAWNPRSEPTDEQINAAAHERMAHDLAAADLRWLRHDGVGADPAWCEHGFFVLDLPVAEATRIALAYEQNAFVVVERGGPARLVVTEVMR